MNLTLFLGRWKSRESSNLPPYGPRRLWQPTFQRTFEVYAKVRPLLGRLHWYLAAG